MRKSKLVIGNVEIGNGHGPSGPPYMMTVHSVKYTTAFITALATSLQVGVVHHITIIIEDIKTHPKVKA